MNLIASDNRRIVIGLGKTGLSIARYFSKQGLSFTVADSRDIPPGLDVFRKEFPGIELILGKFDEKQFLSATELVISPGISLAEPAIAAAKENGVHISGDIEWFCREANAPIIAITGSNGKSTVTTLVGEMAVCSGRKVAVGGNLGVPALDLLNDENELYVLELSSFQLERCASVGAEVATVLNVSEDHLDHHGSLLNYHQAKHKIFRDCKQVVVNRDDPLSTPLIPDDVVRWSFGSGRSDFRAFGIVEQDGQQYLALAREPLLAVNAMKITGSHNVNNALAALAIGSAVGLPIPAMLTALCDFTGLKHRCEFIAEIQGVRYFNDSKGTNVGATVSALGGLADEGKVVLIAGGVDKGADFSPLMDALESHGRAAIFIGEMALTLMTMLADRIPNVISETMSDAVSNACEYALPGDVVLLSPACASFDMFDNYEHRGNVYTDAVLALAGGESV
ncbi:UDP-N-acetylmuramoylalanine--D-glutamate ligase [Zhongshania aliphaticivorans]|uniref:UDP-N-acetylmuramoylalanine--D-glutamate ligase n=1 Tax=Zhongshania aliphaticivorans TaxID=1470434 RepID=A0A5S9N315_9GAMM|nr:UDP-N-acetylmuramoyl-L-alanine--D-glutamate ligase [Zhongshania aliphaticivorans]CAA0083143.1 UDP-N-acetylmuramoylalanine--D-glutamate ligase [Zhongshania aliphaticivorans]CAA0083627.1 UDP-N-acetylmuramoylalanine--D-glutamate ligase [Zhongshania aliphaticivorans]